MSRPGVVLTNGLGGYSANLVVLVLLLVLSALSHTGTCSGYVSMPLSLADLAAVPFQNFTTFEIAVPTIRVGYLVILNSIHLDQIFFF